MSKKLNKLEIKFLTELESMPEPYSTMAMDAIIWNNRETLNILKNKFGKKKIN